MPADALSDLLRAVRLRGALFYDVEASAPWVADAPPATDLRSEVMPDAEHLLEFHAVLEGGCWVGRAGEPTQPLRAGDVVLFPQGDAHRLTSDAGLSPSDPGVATHVAPRTTPAVPGLASPAPWLAPLRLDGGGRARTRLVCGFLGCDARPFNPLLAALPRMLIVPGAADAGSWSATLLRSAVAESQAGRPGGAAVLERMSEMLFVSALRHHVDGLTSDAAGWLAGLHDRTVGAALALLHARPGERWTIERLCEEAHTSRSTLHERFLHFVGMAPMAYLTHWRMQVASRRLREGRDKVARIALDVGYESEAAFARAFKRVVGTPPGAWRAGPSPSSRPGLR